MLDVRGMKCGGCSAAVKRILLQQPGVRGAAVNLLTETAVVRVAVQPEDEALQLAQAAAAAVSSKGFPTSVRSMEDEGLAGDAAALAERKQEELRKRWAGHASGVSCRWRWHPFWHGTSGVCVCKQPSMQQDSRPCLSRMCMVLLVRAQHPPMCVTPPRTRPATHALLSAALATWRLRGDWRWCAAPTIWVTSFTFWGCTTLLTQVGACCWAPAVSTGVRCTTVGQQMSAHRSCMLWASQPLPVQPDERSIAGKHPAYPRAEFMHALGNPWVSGVLGAAALLGPGRPLLLDGALSLLK